jgi:hypothetical protein
MSTACNYPLEEEEEEENEPLDPKSGIQDCQMQIKYMGYKIMFFPQTIYQMRLWRQNFIKNVTNVDPDCDPFIRRCFSKLVYPTTRRATSSQAAETLSSGFLCVWNSFQVSHQTHTIKSWKLQKSTFGVKMLNAWKGKLEYSVAVFTAAQRLIIHVEFLTIFPQIQLPFVCHSDVLNG